MSLGIIITLSIAGLLVLPWIFQALAVLAIKKRKEKSKGFILANLRYLVYVCGQVRAGKTTFMAAYSNLRAEDLKKRALRKIEFICLAFPDIPFWMADEEIYKEFKAGCVDSFSIAKKLCEKGGQFYQYIGRAYDNQIAATKTKFLPMFAQYIDARLALFRNNYVYYYAKAFYCWITNNYAMDYSPAMMNIKDRALDNSYHLLPYTVIAEDEKQLSGKDCTRFMSYSKEDGGSADCMRLIGQLGQETIYYITTNQYWGADVNRERNLATEIVSMEKSTAINPRFMTMFCLRLLEKPFKWRLKWLRKHRAYLITPLMDITVCRSALSKIMYAKKKAASKGVVCFRGLIYHNPQDVGKRPIDAVSRIDRLNAVVDIRYCFGSIDTFLFHSVQQQLISKSKWRLTDEPKEVKDSDLANLILAKKNSQEKEKGDEDKETKGKKK